MHEVPPESEDKVLCPVCNSWLNRNLNYWQERAASLMAEREHYKRLFLLNYSALKQAKRKLEEW